MSGHLWAGLPVALSAGLSVVWLPADRGQSPRTPKFHGLWEDHKHPRAVETSRALQVQTDRARQRGTPDGQPQRTSCSLCAGADQTPSGRREARRQMASVLNWAEQGEEASTEPASRPPAARPQGEESQEAGDLSPPCPVTP